MGGSHFRVRSARRLGSGKRRPYPRRCTREAGNQAAGNRPESSGNGRASAGNRRGLARTLPVLAQTWWALAGDRRQVARTLRALAGSRRALAGDWRGLTRSFGAGMQNRRGTMCPAARTAECEAPGVIEWPAALGAGARFAAPGAALPATEAVAGTMAGSGRRAPFPPEH
eukprot:scaffold15994_cov77-Isochrysis_galbana.AAC.2